MISFHCSFPPGVPVLERELTWSRLQVGTVDRSLRGMWLVNKALFKGNNHLSVWIKIKAMIYACVNPYREQTFLSWQSWSGICSDQAGTVFLSIGWPTMITIRKSPERASQERKATICCLIYMRLYCTYPEYEGKFLSMELLEPLDI